MSLGEVCEHGSLKRQCLVCELQERLEAADELANAAEMLWVVLANVSEGDWKTQSAEWQGAAARWRDEYFKALENVRKLDN